MSRSAIVLAILLPIFGADTCLGQADSTGRSITIPVPENGIIYVRSGKPGGVRIRSRRAPSGARPVVRDVPDRGELDRLARLFDTSGLDVRADLARSNGRVFIVIRDSSDPSRADTLSVAEARSLLRSFGVDDADKRTPADDGPDAAVVDSIVVRVERAIFETGLFRSLRVNFEFDESEILPSAEPTLLAVSSVLEKYPGLQIEVGGHADAVGSDAYNRALSERRARRVRQYLVDTGIDPERVRARGYGEAQPILSNRTPTGRAMNRRVEFKTIGSVDGAVE